MSLDSYRERVEELARRRDGTPIYNGSIEHAAIVIEKLFAHASDRMLILSGKLNARVYGHGKVMREARLFLAEAGHLVRILLEEDDEKDLKDHPFFEEFANYDNVKVRTVPSEWQERYGFHLIVMDGDSYRFERDKRYHAAIAAFGDTDGAKRFENIFDTLWEQSEATSLPQQPHLV